MRPSQIMPAWSALDQSTLRSLGWIFDPRALQRTIPLVNSVAIVSLVLALAVTFRAPREVWRRLPAWRWNRASTLRSLPFYLAELGATAALYVDRFPIDALFGHVDVGAFVFLWSITNAIATLLQVG